MVKGLGVKLLDEVLEILEEEEDETKREVCGMFYHSGSTSDLFPV